MDFEAR